MNRTHGAIALFALVPAHLAAATTQATVNYACDGGSASARYDTSSPSGGVVVTYGGNTLAFRSAPSGSGARYTTAAGPHAIAQLEWWNKGRNATLSELPAMSKAANRLITSCHQAD